MLLVFGIYLVFGSLNEPSWTDWLVLIPAFHPLNISELWSTLSVVWIWAQSSAPSGSWQQNDSNTSHEPSGSTRFSVPFTLKWQRWSNDTVFPLCFYGVEPALAKMLMKGHWKFCEGEFCRPVAQSASLLYVPAPVEASHRPANLVQIPVSAKFQSTNLLPAYAAELFRLTLGSAPVYHPVRSPPIGSCSCAAAAHAPRGPTVPGSFAATSVSRPSSAASAFFRTKALAPASSVLKAGLPLQEFCLWRRLQPQPRYSLVYFQWV